MNLKVRSGKLSGCRTFCCAQVCQHEWVASRGGLVPRLLDPGVARGAANVASVRRLRNMVHGVTALKQLRRWAAENPDTIRCQHPSAPCWLHAQCLTIGPSAPKELMMPCLPATDSRRAVCR